MRDNVLLLADALLECVIDEEGGFMSEIFMNPTNTKCKCGFCTDVAGFINKNAQDFLYMIRDENFLLDSYDGPLKGFHDNHIKPEKMQAKSTSSKFFKEIVDNYNKEIDDGLHDGSFKFNAFHAFSTMILILGWLHDKQVFTFSDQLINDLHGANNVSFKYLHNLISHLPFNNFLIDLSDNTFIADKKYSMILFTSFFDQSKDSYIVGIKAISFNADNIEFALSAIADIEKDDEGSFSSMEGIETTDEEKEILDLTVNIITYLSSIKPDVRENQTQKMIYRKGKSISNKKREVRKWDVGFRYAESVKKSSPIYENKLSLGKGGTPKRAHMRKAHWHHYWIGSGENKELIVKWVAACGVNLEFESELPFVSHAEGKVIP